MRILLFTDTWRPTVNGVVRALDRLVDHATAGGHTVAVVSPGPGRGSDLPAHGDPRLAFHQALPALPFPLYPELSLARPWLGSSIRRRLARFEPSVVHVVTEGPVGWLGRGWARKAGRPLVSSYCTNFAEYARGYGLGVLERPAWWLLRRFHGASHTTLCPSHATRRVLLDRGFRPPIRLWSRGVDAEGFHPSRRDPRVREAMAPGAEVVLLYVGRIAPEKRLDLLLEAWPRIRREAARRAALVLVGDGPALPELRRRGVEGVHFTGYRRGEALAASYASADLFLFGSDTETFGQVVTEAMASGLPAVVPARGGVVDLVDDGRTGRLFVPGDPASLADAALPLVTDDVLRKRMSREARTEARKRSWSGVFQDLLETYQEASSTRDPAVTPSRHDGVKAHGTLKMNSRGA